MRGLQRVLREGVPLLSVPLCLVASVLTAAPWLRSFPASVGAAPLYGAAVLSVLVPLVVAHIRPTWLWLSVLIDAVAFVVFTLAVVLQNPAGFAELIHGLYRGPSEILTFALPLVSPRSLMVAPAALIWLAGALAGECVARRWYTLLPYLGFLTAFGLAYAGTQRAAGSDLASARLRETVLAAALLATLLLMRVAQSWVRQDEGAESTQADGVLPLRGLLVGTAATLAITVIAAFAVQTDAFPKRSQAAQRVPTVDKSTPLTPLAFVAGLRPRTLHEPGQPLFTVKTNAPSPGYFALANVDFYDGSGWAFTRTFRPSGGVLPADTDAALRSTHPITQQYRIADGPLTHAPWMPFVYRAQKVTGTSVNIDPTSGMIVPASNLRGGASYTVQSNLTATTFDQVKAASTSPDTATPTIDSQLPGELRDTLDRLVNAFTQETGTPSSPALPFLQALQRDLRTNYTLSTAAQGSAAGAASPAPGATSPASTPTSAARSSAKSVPTAPAKSSAKPARSSAKPAPKSSARSSPRHRPFGALTRPLGGRPSTHQSTPATGRKSSPKPTPEPTPKTTPVSTPAASADSSNSPTADLAGGTGFADVLASILGPSRSGTPEQFATLIALVARDLGVPARVVTGFRVEPPDGTGQLPFGQYNVTTADAWTWTEVPLTGVGWVVLDSAPARFSADQKPTASGSPPPSSSSAPPSQNALVTQGDNGHAVAPKSHVADVSTAPTHAVLVALLVALAALVVVLLLILLSRKRVRAARRRRSPDPRTKLIGAWQESLDVLTEAGLPELTTLTSAEIAELTGEQFGAETGATAASLGTAANAVAYSRATIVAPQEAEDAWARQRSLSKAVRRQLGVRGRFAAGLRYHRPKLTQRPTSPQSWADASAASRRESAGGRDGSVGVRERVQRRGYEGRRRAH
jgi:hypothetical protein